VDPAVVVASLLHAAGTAAIFGVPGGGANLDLIGAFEERGGRFVLCHGETSGAIMAAAFAERSGTVGACLATRGPGAASMANGVANAQLDRIPLVAVCEAIADADSRVTHQRLDHRALYAPITKAALTIGPGGSEAAAAAIALARAPVPGAVLLDCSADAPSSPAPAVAPAVARDGADARRALEHARRPVVVIGVGARAHGPDVARLVAGTRIPVLETYATKGIAPPANVAGLLTGGTLELDVLDAADVIVAVGLDPVELIPAPWRAVAPLVDVAAEHVSSLALNDGWTEEPASARERALARLVSPVAGLDPRVVVLEAAAAHPGALATVDAGAHMLVAMPFWPGRALISSGLATMGFALPAAIGAALARPGERVVCLSGDGGLGMCLAELETLARLELPVTVVVLDDATLSLIAIKQRATGHGGAAATRYREADFAAIARGFGLPAWDVGDEPALRAALVGAASTAGPALVRARVDPGGYPAVLAATRVTRSEGARL
jgi:acetolactate synthase-1/2/3 large subunit